MVDDQGNILFCHSFQNGVHVLSKFFGRDMLHFGNCRYFSHAMILRYLLNCSSDSKLRNRKCIFSIRLSVCQCPQNHALY